MAYRLHPLTEMIPPPLPETQEGDPQPRLENPAAITLADDRLLLVWAQQQQPEPGAPYEVVAQHYGTDGQSEGEVITLFEDRDVHAPGSNPHLVALSDGGFAVLRGGTDLFLFDSAGEQRAETTLELPDRTLTTEAGAELTLPVTPATPRTEPKHVISGEFTSYGLRSLTPLDNDGVAVTLNARHPGRMDSYPRGEAVFTQTFDSTGRAEGEVVQVTPWMEEAPLLGGLLAYGQDFMDRVDGSADMGDGKYALLLRIGTEHPENRGEDPETPGDSARIMLKIFDRYSDEHAGTGDNTDNGEPEDEEVGPVREPSLGPVSDLIHVGDVPGGMNATPDIATLEDGSVVVAWRSANQVRWQRFDSEGEAKGDVGVVPGSYTKPEVQPTPDGGFLLTLGFRTDTMGRPLEMTWAQRFDAEGEAVGRSFPFNRSELFGDFSSHDQTFIVLADGGAQFSMWRGTDFAEDGQRQDIALQTFMPEVLGTAAQDTLEACDTGTVLFGFDGDDRLISGPGDDLMFGGEGENTAVFSGAFADYAIETDPDTDITTVTDLRDSDVTENHDGTDRLHDISLLEFSDQTVSLAPEIDIAVNVMTVVGVPLADVTVSFDMAEDNTVLTAQTDGDGTAVFTVPPEGSATVSAERVYDPAVDGGPTASDALDVLRLAVGLEPSFGPASAENFVAADINQDGQVTASDALDVLRAAVGLESENAPRWVFFDADTDWDDLDLDRGNTAVETGVDIVAMQSDQSRDMTGILLGSMQEYA